MEDQLVKEYVDGASLNACSRKYHIQIPEVRKILTNHGVHIRNRSEQNFYTNTSRAYAVNHAYFSKLTQENAYYIGFLAADGNVSSRNNSISLSLAVIDTPFVEEYKKNLGIKAPIKFDTFSRGGFEVANLTFSSAQAKRDLAKYSVVPRKTYIGTSMKNIPDEFKESFVKGYFDGDGSFSHTKGTTTAILKICSHTRGILDEFKEWFDKKFNGEFRSNIYKMERKPYAPLYSWEISTVPSIMLLSSFYKLDTPCLSRKKKKFEDYLAFREENLDPRARTAFTHKAEKVC